MNKKHIFLTLTLSFALLAIAYAIYYLYRLSVSIPNAESIYVSDIKRLDFDTVLNSHLVWFPGKRNNVAAVLYRADMGSLVYSYDLGNGKVDEVYNLLDYGVGLGESVNFFWSADGNYLVTGSGGIVDLKAKLGYWIELPDNCLDVNVVGISSDGKTAFVDAWDCGFYFIDIDSGNNWPFTVNSDLFSEPIHPLALSPDGNWVAVRSHHPSLSSTEQDIPQSLYILRSDGEEVRLIADGIVDKLESAVFSPDSTKIIWVEVREGKQYLNISNVDGSGAHLIYSTVDLSSESIISSNMVWSPDGKFLVYAGPPDQNYIYPFWVLSLDTEVKRGR
jgi:dipeptidyl aminopeptidase/acylaminoacyl peptidase